MLQLTGLPWNDGGSELLPSSRSSNSQAAMGILLVQQNTQKEEQNQHNVRNQLNLQTAFNLFLKEQCWASNTRGMASPTLLPNNSPLTLKEKGQTTRLLFFKKKESLEGKCPVFRILIKSPQCVVSRITHPSWMCDKNSTQFAWLVPARLYNIISLLDF